MSHDKRVVQKMIRVVWFSIWRYVTQCYFRFLSFNHDHPSRLFAIVAMPDVLGASGVRGPTAAGEEDDEFDRMEDDIDFAGIEEEDWMRWQTADNGSSSTASAGVTTTTESASHPNTSPNVPVTPPVVIPSDETPPAHTHLAETMPPIAEPSTVAALTRSSSFDSDSEAFIIDEAFLAQVDAFERQLLGGPADGALSFCCFSDLYWACTVQTRMASLTQKISSGAGVDMANPYASVAPTRELVPCSCRM